MSKTIVPPVLPRTGVESHAHLDADKFPPDELPDILNRAYAAGVEWIGQVFLHPEEYEKRQADFANHPTVFFLLGIHPTDANQYTSTTAAEITACVKKDSRIRCIGEIGLDYYWKEMPPGLQKDVFIAQLRLAKELDMPVAIHCRDAVEDTFALLESEGFRNRPLLWHCFGGDTNAAMRIIDAGWHLSIPGPVTFPANKALREAVAVIPADRLMVETDCPFLAPVPLRGKRNEPSYLPYIIQVMADARGMDVAELWTLCGNNAKRFFGLPPTPAM